MADSNVAVTEGSGKNIDTRTITGGDHRQVVILGDETVANAITEVRATDPDSNSEGLVVRDVNTSAIVSGLDSVRIRDLVTGTIATIVSVTDIAGISARPDINRVHNIVDGTISTVASVTGIGTTVAVFFDRGEPTVVAKPGAGTFTVNFDPGHTLGIIKNITETVAVYFDRGNPTVTANAGSGSFSVQFDPGHTLGKIDTVASLGGTVAVVMVSNAGDSVYYTKTYSSASGSVVGSYPSGKTVVAPDAGDKIKVFALSVTTTAQEHMVVTFNNGGEAPTEYWRYALQAPAKGIAGANLAVTPPGYLFATAADSTLAIKVDSISLVHYAVSYFVESV